jgi:hypothetical protein
MRRRLLVRPRRVSGGPSSPRQRRVRILRVLFLILLAATFTATAYARGATRFTTRIDLPTGTVVPVPPTALPGSTPPLPPRPRSHASVIKGSLHLRDATGSDHEIATIDPRSWSTWDVEIGSIFVFAIRTFVTGNASDVGHDVVRAYSADGALLWSRSARTWIPRAFQVNGALALASNDQLELVDPATQHLRCVVTPPSPSGWPIGTMPIDGGAFLYETNAQSVAFDPATCALRWSASNGKHDGMPVLHRGKLYSSVTVGASVEVVERDALTGSKGRTFTVATTTEFFDRAAARIVPAGDSLFVDGGFVVLD